MLLGTGWARLHALGLLETPWDGWTRLNYKSERHAHHKTDCLGRDGTGWAATFGGARLRLFWRVCDRWDGLLCMLRALGYASVWYPERDAGMRTRGPIAVVVL